MDNMMEPWFLYIIFIRTQYHLEKSPVIYQSHQPILKEKKFRNETGILSLRVEMGKSALYRYERSSVSYVEVG